MNEILEMDIGKLIEKYPPVEAVLDAYGVRCEPTPTHTCHKLKDTAVLHGMSPDTERRLLNAVARIVYPERQVCLPLHGEAVAPAPGERKPPSPPVQQLVEDHKLIRRWVDLIPRMVDTLDLETEEGRRVILDGVDFVLLYTGKLYHAKEERILFNYYVDESLEFVKDLCADHDIALEHAEAIEAAVEKRNGASVRRHLLAYAELLRGHIRREDEILYPWIDRELSPSQVYWLGLQFKQVQEANRDLIAKQKRYIETVEAAMAAAAVGPGG